MYQWFIALSFVLISQVAASREDPKLYSQEYRQEAQQDQVQPISNLETILGSQLYSSGEAVSCEQSGLARDLWPLNCVYPNSEPSKLMKRWSGAKAYWVCKPYQPKSANAPQRRACNAEGQRATGQWHWYHAILVVAPNGQDYRFFGRRLKR